AAGVDREVLETAGRQAVDGDGDAVGAGRGRRVQRDGGDIEEGGRDDGDAAGARNFVLAGRGLAHRETRRRALRRERVARHVLDGGEGSRRGQTGEIDTNAGDRVSGRCAGDGHGAAARDRGTGRVVGRGTRRGRAAAFHNQRIGVPTIPGEGDAADEAGGREEVAGGE